MYHTRSILAESWSASSESDLEKEMFCVRREGREPGREASSVSVWERALMPGRGKLDLVGVVATDEDVVGTEEGAVETVDVVMLERTVKC